MNGKFFPPKMALGECNSLVMSFQKPLYKSKYVCFAFGNLLYLVNRFGMHAATIESTSVSKQFLSVPSRKLCTVWVTKKFPFFVN